MMLVARSLSGTIIVGREFPFGLVSAAYLWTIQIMVDPLGYEAFYIMNNQINIIIRCCLRQGQLVRLI